MKLLSLLPKPVRHWGWRVLEFSWSRWNKSRALVRLWRPRSGKPHGLDHELVASLTSYPARFGTLHLTLGCLLDQTVRPDRVVLWLAHGDASALPDAVRALERRGLEIRECDDFRSHKKLVPSVVAFPSAYIVTADDDLYYPPDWLETLVSAVDPESRTIACHRVIRPHRLPNGELAPFNDWEWDVQDERSRSASDDILLESGAGALFPPGSLDPIIIDSATFMRLSPTSDDLWFNVCARKAGSRLKKVGGSLALINWPGSQQSALWESNRDGGNDDMIRALEAEFSVLQSIGRRDRAPERSQFPD